MSMNEWSDFWTGTCWSRAKDDGCRNQSVSCLTSVEMLRRAGTTNLPDLHQYRLFFLSALLLIQWSIRMAQA